MSLTNRVPQEVAVACGGTGVNDRSYLLSHVNFTISFVSIYQHFFDQVCGGKQPVGFQKRLIPLLITSPLDHRVNREQCTLCRFFLCIGGLLILSRKGFLCRMSEYTKNSLRLCTPPYSPLPAAASVRPCEPD